MKKYINQYALLLFGLLATLGFNQKIFAQTRDEVWIVADSRVDCTGVAQMKCLQVKKPQDEKWTRLYQNIEKFNYADGYTYVVRVKVETVANPPADASKMKYTLKKVFNRERTGATTANSGDEKPLWGSAELNGKVWQLRAIDGAAVNSDRATFSFDFNKNRVGGNGGCNGFGGTLTQTGDGIKISQIISTKMFCENGSDVENRYFSALEKVTKYRIRDGKLHLLNGETIVLEFAEKK